LNDICARHVVGLYWVPGHAGVGGNEIADGLARDGSVLGFLWPEPVLGVTMRVIRKRLNQWLISQHWASWRDLGNTQRQARELISWPCPGFRVKFLSFNLLKPNDIYIYICRTAALTSRRYILNIYSTNIRTEYFKYAA